MIYESVISLGYQNRLAADVSRVQEKKNWWSLSLSRSLSHPLTHTNTHKYNKWEGSMKGYVRGLLSGTYFRCPVFGYFLFVSKIYLFICCDASNILSNIVDLHEDTRFRQNQTSSHQRILAPNFSKLRYFYQIFRRIFFCTHPTRFCNPDPMKKKKKKIHFWRYWIETNRTMSFKRNISHSGIVKQVSLFLTYSV